MDGSIYIIKVREHLPSNITELRAMVDKSVSHMTEDEYKEKLGLFALAESAPSRKVKSFASDGSLDREGLFLNGVMTDFDQRKDKLVVDNLLKLAREGSTRFLLDKSGMGKTYTWFRMCSRQDSEENLDSSMNVFVLLLTVPGEVLDSPKMRHSPTFYPIIEFDRKLSESKSQLEDQRKSNWGMAREMMTRLIDAHYAVLCALRMLIPGVCCLLFVLYNWCYC